MEPVSNVNWDAHGKVPWLLIFKHLTFTQLNNPSKACKKMREWILNDIVRDRFMKREGVLEVKGELCLKTFGNRNVVIALDCSHSMTQSTEHWRYDVALKEVKALVNKYKYLAESKGIIFIPFATYTTCSILKKVDEVDGTIEFFRGRNFPQKGLGWKTDWKYVFDDIHHRITTKIRQRSIVHIVSDFEGSALLSHRIWRDSYDENLERPVFNLCQVGRSIEGSSFIKQLLEMNSISADGEPESKKMKAREPLEINFAHIPNEDGTRQLLQVSRTPTTVIEYVDRMEGESEELDPTHNDEDEESRGEVQ